LKLLEQIFDQFLCLSVPIENKTVFISCPFIRKLVEGKKLLLLSHLHTHTHTHFSIALSLTTNTLSVSFSITYTYTIISHSFFYPHTHTHTQTHTNTHTHNYLSNSFLCLFSTHYTLSLTHTLSHTQLSQLVSLAKRFIANPPREPYVEKGES